MYLLNGISSLTTLYVWISFCDFYYCSEMFLQIRVVKAFQAGLDRREPSLSGPSAARLREISRQLKLQVEHEGKGGVVQLLTHVGAVRCAAVCNGRYIFNIENTILLWTVLASSRSFCLMQLSNFARRHPISQQKRIAHNGIMVNEVAGVPRSVSRQSRQNEAVSSVWNAKWFDADVSSKWKAPFAVALPCYAMCP